MRYFQHLKTHGKLWLFVLLFLFSLYSTFLYLTVGQRGYDNVLVVLSQQFLNHHISLPIYNLPVRDISSYFNNYYVYFGPLSSILMMPFVLVFGQAFPEVSIGVFSLVVSFIAAYFIAKKFLFKTVDALWLALFFVFSTVLFSSSVINITAYQVEALGVPFILLAIWAYLSKRNPFIIGVFIALAVMTRFTLLLSVIFFMAEFLQRRVSLKYLVLLIIPVLLAVGILGAYNNRRFHSFFESGYSYNISKSDGPIGGNFKYGQESIMHIPANLYSLLIMSPEPLLKDNGGGMFLKFPYLKANPWGMAIWYTSPLFLLLLFRFKKGKYTLSAAITGIFLAIPVFVWYSIGYAQFGYRYALDFLPFLFLLLLMSLSPKLSKYAIALIVIGVFFNCVYSDSMWELYPLFNIFH